MSSDTQTDVRPVSLTLSLGPINASASLRDQAYAKLKQAIADADIYHSREEIRLDEKELTEALGVSRTPVREAMTLLEQEGFLRTVPRRGIYIQRKTKKEIVVMICMWAALESMAARLATTRASDEEIATLRHMFDNFRDSTPAEHIEEYSQANIAFHHFSFVSPLGPFPSVEPIDRPPRVPRPLDIEPWPILWPAHPRAEPDRNSPTSQDPAEATSRCLGVLPRPPRNPAPRRRFERCRGLQPSIAHCTA